MLYSQRVALAQMELLKRENLEHKASSKEERLLVHRWETV